MGWGNFWLNWTLRRTSEHFIVMKMKLHNLKRAAIVSKENIKILFAMLKFL